jgi:hypothetical protein
MGLQTQTKKDFSKRWKSLGVEPKAGNEPLRCNQKLDLSPTNAKIYDGKVEIQLANRFDDRSVGVVPKTMLVLM